MVPLPAAPAVYPEIVLPGLASGAIWAAAQISWFFANDPTALGQTIAFPIIAVGPGLVASLWGVFAFGEIKGQKNMVFLVVAFVLVTSAAITIAASNI